MYFMQKHNYFRKHPGLKLRKSRPVEKLGEPADKRRSAPSRVGSANPGGGYVREAVGSGGSPPGNMNLIW